MANAKWREQHWCSPRGPSLHAVRCVFCCEGDAATFDAPPFKRRLLEYLAEQKPDAGIWPADLQDRARARSLSAEMHAGFNALRRACPMNLRKEFVFKPRGGAAARKDVERFEGIVRDRMMRSGGPFLFGEWCAADAMYAPLASRIATYNWPVNHETQTYVEAVLGEASFQKWRAAGVEESWVLAHDEVK